MLLESIITEEVFSLQPNESWQHFIYFPYRLFRIWPFGQTLISGLQLLQNQHRFKYKRKELKGNLGWLEREEAQAYIIFIFLKNISSCTIFLVLIRLCEGPGLYRIPRWWSLDSLQDFAGIFLGWIPPESWHWEDSKHEVESWYFF